MRCGMCSTGLLSSPLVTASPEPSTSRVLDAHARLSLGASHHAIYRLVASALAARDIAGRRFIDIGCGRGALRPFVQNRFEEYVGVDGVRYDDFPDAVEFHELDLDGEARLPASATGADVVAAVETIEHLENPRALVRQLIRLARPGGWIILTTPNQRSALSLLTLCVKGQFSAFQDAEYPAHITALLDSDLRRIGAELGLTDAAIEYTERGRIPGTAWHYPRVLTSLLPRAMSDNLLYIARTSRDVTGPAHR